MTRKKKQVLQVIDNSLLQAKNMEALQKQYEEELETNPQFSLIPDPKGELSLSNDQKAFITHYVQFKNIAMASELAGIELDEARQMFVSYDVQKEIRRINKALYHRQFRDKMLTIDEIGGWLTSLLTDNNVPLVDQLKTTDKLRVADMLIKLNEYKAGAITNPGEFAARDIEVEIKNLSVNAIQTLLVQNNVIKEKNSAIDKLDPDTVLTVEERAYLSTLPLKDLLQMIEDANQKQGGDDE